MIRALTIGLVAIGILFGAPGTADDSVTADDIPVANTPGCGWTEFPPPVLASCTEPLAEGAADLRGLWKAESGLVGHIERVEQCGNRVVITAGKIIHDMRTDDTLENGVNDVAAANCKKISVAARFIDGRLELRPFDGPVMVTRHLESDEMVWVYGGRTSRLHRIESLPGETK